MTTSKRIVALIIIVIIFSCICVMITGCSAKGQFYTLQEAYDEGLLTKEDLQAIADYHNSGEDCKDKLNDSIVALIKESAAYYARHDKKNDIKNAKSEDYLLLKYYGVYNGSYAIILNNPYLSAPAVEIDVWENVGGVLFHYVSPNNIVIYRIK